MKKSCCGELSVATAISVNVTFVPLRNTSDGPGVRNVVIVRPRTEPASEYQVTFVFAPARILRSTARKWEHTKDDRGDGGGPTRMRHVELQPSSNAAGRRIRHSEFRSSRPRAP